MVQVDQVQIYHLTFMKITKNMIYYDHLRWFYLKNVFIIIGIFDLKFIISSARMHIICLSEIIGLNQLTTTTSDFCIQTHISDIFKSYSHDLNHFRSPKNDFIIQTYTMVHSIHHN